MKLVVNRFLFVFFFWASACSVSTYGDNSKVSTYKRLFLSRNGLKTTVTASATVVSTFENVTLYIEVENVDYFDLSIIHPGLELRTRTILKTDAESDGYVERRRYVLFGRLPGKYVVSFSPINGVAPPSVTITVRSRLVDGVPPKSMTLLRRTKKIRVFWFVGAAAILVFVVVVIIAFSRSSIIPGDAIATVKKIDHSASSLRRDLVESLGIVVGGNFAILTTEEISLELNCDNRLDDALKNELSICLDVLDSAAYSKAGFDQNERKRILSVLSELQRLRGDK